MFCHKCGKKLPEDAAFCFKCGTALINEDSDVAENVDTLISNEADVPYTKGTLDISAFLAAEEEKNKGKSTFNECIAYFMTYSTLHEESDTLYVKLDDIDYHEMPNEYMAIVDELLTSRRKASQELTNYINAFANLRDTDIRLMDTVGTPSIDESKTIIASINNDIDHLIVVKEGRGTGNHIEMFEGFISLIEKYVDLLKEHDVLLEKDQQFSSTDESVERLDSIQALIINVTKQKLTMSKFIEERNNLSDEDKDLLDETLEFPVSEIEENIRNADETLAQLTKVDQIIRQIKGLKAGAATDKKIRDDFWEDIGNLDFKTGFKKMLVRTASAVARDFLES